MEQVPEAAPRVWLFPTENVKMGTYSVAHLCANAPQCGAISLRGFPNLEGLKVLPVPRDPTLSFRCPACGRTDVRKSHSRNLRDIFMQFINKRPFRCRACKLRFYRHSPKAVRQGNGESLLEQ